MTENFDINKHGRVIFEVNEAPQPTDLELKIRKEVMARINKSLDIAMNGHCCDDIIEAMEDVRLMLNLLWGK